MKVRIQFAAIVLTSLMFVLNGSTFAEGAVPYGGGTVTGDVTAGSAIAKVPQLTSIWNGSYSYQPFAEAPVSNHQVRLYLSSDSKGKLAGRFCIGLASPGCFLVTGTVTTAGAVSLQFDAKGNHFTLQGTVAPMYCLDGNPGKVISGGFTGGEGSGGFSINSCR